MCVKYIIALKACYGSFLSGGMWNMQYDVSELADKNNSPSCPGLTVIMETPVLIPLKNPAHLLARPCHKRGVAWQSTSWDKTKTVTTIM